MRHVVFALFSNCHGSVASRQFRAIFQDMAEAVDEAGLDEALASDAGGSPMEQTIKRLTRSNNRLSWALIVLVLLVTGVGGVEIKMMQDRQSDLETGVKMRVNRADDDFARIQDQTAAMRGGIELLHKELGQLRTQVDEVNRQLRRTQN
jgi:uncharacterized protein HemX